MHFIEFAAHNALAPHVTNTHPLNSKLPLDLAPALLALQILPQALGLLGGALLALAALALLEAGAALHDAGDDLGGVDVLELVVCDLAVQVQGLGDGVGVVGQRHELGDAVVDGRGRAVGERQQEGFGEREGRAEDGGVDVLGGLVGWGDGEGGGCTLHCSTQRPRSKMFMMG